MGRALSGDGYAFVPRDVVLQHAAFGKVPGLLDPAPPHTVDSERYRAAMIQHLMCATARQSLLTKNGQSPARFVRYSSERGLGQDRVRRVFRGATMAQFADFAYWSAHFPEVAAAVAEYTQTWVPQPEYEPQIDSLTTPIEAAPVVSPAPPIARQPAPRVVTRQTPQHPFR